MIKITVEKTNLGKNFPVPKYATDFSSGVDLMASINKPIKINVADIKLIPSGIKLKIPQGYEGQVRSRSGLALKFGISVLNSPGTIDSDYRGEISVILINHGKKSFMIDPGMRIAQLVIIPISKCLFVEEVINTLETKRGSGGFGSTGIKTREKDA